MKKMTVIALACGCFSLVPVAANAQTEAASTTAANPLSQVDKDFVQAASMSSSTEIDASKLATSNSSDKDNEDPLKDYNVQLGTQWFHDDNGNNYNVDPSTATVNGPDGEGVYKVNGNDVTKLHAGYS